MKPFFTIAFLLLFKTVLCQQWCPPGAKWNYVDISLGSPVYIQLSYDKDTVVDMVACKKLLEEIVNTEPTTHTTSSKYTFARNDTIYFWHEQFSSFGPVYFFNAKAGDTIPYFPSETDFCIPHLDTSIRQLVDSAGITQINNHSLRYYNARIIDTTNELHLSYRVTERIGIPYDFIEPIIHCGTDYDTYLLICYQDDSFGIYHADTAISCDYAFTSIENEDNITSITLFPNPATESFQIQISGLAYRQTTLVLYDDVGKMVNELPLKTVTTTVSRKNLSNGIYFWQIVADGQILNRGKIVFE